jgi:hypothetical protein
MAPLRFRASFRLLLSAGFLAGAACGTTPTGRPPEPPSSYSVQQELGQRDVVQAGQEYARNNSIVLAEAGEAVEIRPNLWRLRFALADRPGRVLEMEFDELARRVTRAQEIDVIPDRIEGAGEGSEAVPSGQTRGPIP